VEAGAGKLQRSARDVDYNPIRDDSMLSKKAEAGRETRFQ